MKKTKFKVGDKVRIIGTGTEFASENNGLIGKIVSIGDWELTPKDTYYISCGKNFYRLDNSVEALVWDKDIEKLVGEDVGIIKTVALDSRKNMPVYSGVLKYFPDAIKELSKVSMAGNEQHNPGQPLYWDRSKSTDELDALTRHLIDAGKIDTDGIRHSAKVAWRALANLQKEIENGK